MNDFQVNCFLLCSIFGAISFAQIRDRGLADFGGDVSQYMSLLQGSSAFSFKPGKEQRSDDENSVRTREKNDEYSSRYAPNGANTDTTRRSMSEKQQRGFPGFGKRGYFDNGDSVVNRESELGEFGGDYGSYLKLLEGDSALGFNPQADPIADNQDLQTDVFGGGMSGKFWDMYKGSSSYDSLDEDDGMVAEQLGLSDDDDGLMRQAGEIDQPEDAANRERTTSSTTGMTTFQDETYIIAFKPAKKKMTKLYNELKTAFKDNDKLKMGNLLDALNVKKILSHNEASPPSRSMRKVMVIEGNDEEQKEDEGRDVDVEKRFKEFVEKLKEKIPDPIETNKGLSMSYRNLTLYGLSAMKVCGMVKKSYGNHWQGTVCIPNLSSTISSAPGPGVPFKGKVIGIFKGSKIRMKFLDVSSNIHVLSVKTSSETSKFVPTYDSSIPLNPWSKVSMSGYMVSRIKKILPSLLEKTILKLTHVVENMDNYDD